MELKPNQENFIEEKSGTRIFKYVDEDLKPTFTTREITPSLRRIIVYPYTRSRERGIVPKKVKKIIFLGWSRAEDLPSDFRGRKRAEFVSWRSKVALQFVHRAFPEVIQITVGKDSETKFSKTKVEFNWAELLRIFQLVSREKKYFDTRRKSQLSIGFSELTDKVTPRYIELGKNELVKLFSVYSEFGDVSNADVDRVLSILSLAPTARISVTDNFIKTKDKINFAYLEDVEEKFDALMSVQKDNEKDWQVFFEKHGWILSSLFPYRVIIHKREAFVGGKTLENSEGRVVDFLFRNGFRDGYALLEVKTHRKPLLKPAPYRKPAAFAMTDELSGSISQCVDQKNTFLSEFGQKYRIADPKVVLLIGNKASLTEDQSHCFDLLRGNQKNLDIVTFDELREKIAGLMEVLRMG